MPMGCPGGSWGEQDVVADPREERHMVVVPCHASGALVGSLSPRQCFPAAKPKSGHENRVLPPCSSFVVINQITVISLREEFRFYLQE